MASLVFALGMVWVVAAELAMRAARSNDDWSTVIFAFPLLVLPALFLFGLCEVAFSFFRPERTRKWAMIGAASFAGAIAAGFSAMGAAMGNPTFLASPIGPQLIGCAVAAAIIWWAELPPPAPDLAKLFG